MIKTIVIALMTEKVGVLLALVVFEIKKE